MNAKLAASIIESHVRFPAAEYEALRAEAERQDRSVAWVIRDCVAQVLGRKSGRVK